MIGVLVSTITFSPGMGSLSRPPTAFSVVLTKTFTPLGASDLMTRVLNLSAATSSSTTRMQLHDRLGVQTLTTSP